MTGNTLTLMSPLLTVYKASYSDDDDSDPANSQSLVTIFDIIFSVLFGISFIFVLTFSIKNFCFITNMRNLPNILYVVLILMTLLSKQIA